MTRAQFFYTIVRVLFIRSSKVRISNALAYFKQYIKVSISNAKILCTDCSDVTGFKKSGSGTVRVQTVGFGLGAGLGLGSRVRVFVGFLHLVSSQIGVRVWFGFMLKSWVQVSVCKKQLGSGFCQVRARPITSLCLTCKQVVRLGFYTFLPEYLQSTMI